MSATEKQVKKQKIKMVGTQIQYSVFHFWEYN